MKNKLLHRLTFCAILAAAYCALTVSTSAIAYGPIQFRIAEALCILPFFATWTSWGLTAGCLLANIFSTVTPLDMVIGTLATLLACLLTSRIKLKWLAPLPPVIVNGLLVGGMLALVETPDAVMQGFATFSLQVAAGELAVMYLLGLPLLLVLQKNGLGQRLQNM